MVPAYRRAFRLSAGNLGYSWQIGTLNGHVAVYLGGVGAVPPVDPEQRFAADSGKFLP
jgi:hypothetical protein